METLELIPLLQAYEFSLQIEDELSIYGVNTHYNNDILFVDWGDPESLTYTKTWLIEKWD